MRNTQELCLYSDSNWCVDIFSNLQLYKRRNWIAKGKQPVRHHDIWEEINQSMQSRIASVSMTHVYGHNKLVYLLGTSGSYQHGANSQFFGDISSFGPMHQNVVT